MMFDAHGESEVHAESLAPFAKSTRLPVPIIDALLDLLAEDEGFRARFEANPRAALLELGYETPAAAQGVLGADPVLSFGYFHGGLASKEKVAATRDRWHSELRNRQQAIFGPFDMCA